MYRRFIEDPDDIVRFEGGRFVVLRATGEVADAHRHVCDVLGEQLERDGVLCLTNAHVTLAGFAKGAGLDAARDLVAEWARTVPPLKLEIEKAGYFPAPFQIVILQIRNTDALRTAMVSLRTRINEQQFGDGGMIPAADWIFHVSVAYCASLSGEAWAAVTKVVDGLSVPAADCVVGHVEIAAIDNGLEYSGGVLELSGS